MSAAPRVVFDEAAYRAAIGEREARTVGAEASYRRAPSAGFAPTSLGELATRLDINADRAWLVREYLGLGELLILYGPGKVGKSTFAASLAAAVARGEEFLGHTTMQGGVLWLDNENHASRVVRKLAEAGCPADTVLVHCGEPPAIADVRSLILDRGVRLLVVDSLIGQLRPEDENDAAQVRTLISPLLDLAHETETTALAIAHARKSGGDHGDAMRGSSALRDAVDGYLQMTRVGGGQPDDDRRQLIYEGRNDEPPRQLVVRRTIAPVDDAFVIRSRGGESIVQTNVSYSLARGPIQERRDKILSALTRGPQEADVIAEELRLAKTTVLADLELLRGAKKVIRSGAGKKGNPFVFTLSLSDSFDVNE